MMINLHETFTSLAKKILVENISTKPGSLLNILCQSWRNADVMCHGYKLPDLNWCCQLLLCFDGELNLFANEKCSSSQP